MKTKISTIALIGLSLWPCAVAFSATVESSTPVTLTLERAEALALAQSPSLMAATERAKAAGRRVLPNYLPNDPMLMVERSGQTGSPLDWGGATMEMWMAEEQFRFPGKSLVEASKMRAEARKATADSDNTRRNALLQAREAYWDFYYRSRVGNILSETDAQWRKLNALFKDRDLTGQGNTVKAVKLQVDLVRAANERLGAAKALRVSEANLSHLFNAAPETHYVLGEPPGPQPPDVTQDQAVERTLAGNPEVASAVAMVESAKASKRLAALEHLPDFSVRAYGSRMVGASGFSDYGMRVGISVPLFFPFKQTQASREASAMAAAAKADLADMRGAATHDVAEAYVEATTAWELFKSYQDADLSARLKRAWGAAQVAYRNEQMSASDLIENYNMYLETLSELHRARADYGKALARLDYTMGNIVVKGERHE
jgi:cobalt-zinc-cadmium efflux system outer membrane protein